MEAAKTNPARRGAVRHRPRRVAALGI